MNYSKKIMATLLVAFGLITNVNATSKWDTTRNDYSTTTDEITVAYDEENYTIIYTIPQNYSGEEIYFNITDDIETILAGSYVPGENAPFKIRVINNSDVDYHYVDNSYTVGAYMRGENTVFEEVFRTDLGLVEANSQNDLREFAMNLDGDNVVNAHQIMNFGYMMSFRLEQEIVYGDLIVHYIDEDGNKLTEDITSSDEVGNPYETKSMEFDGYHLIRVEGHETGEYIDGTIHVTYVYALDGIGDVEDPEEPTTPVEPEEPTDSVEPPHTDVEVNSVSINNIIYYCEDRKKYIK